MGSELLEILVVPTKQCRFGNIVLSCFANTWFFAMCWYKLWYVTRWNYWPALFCRDYPKIVLLPWISAVPVIKRRRHFVPAMIAVFYPLNHFWGNFLVQILNYFVPEVALFHIFVFQLYSKPYFQTQTRIRAGCLTDPKDL